MNPDQRVMPTLRITNYARSKAFYVDGLGFHIDWNTALSCIFQCSCRYPERVWLSF